MFRFLSIILWASFATLFANEGNLPANNNKEIAEFMQNFDKAYNTHNAKEIANFWVPNGDLITAWGRWMMGRAQIEKNFEAEKNTPMGRSSIQQTVDFNRALSPDLSSADVTIKMSIPTENNQQQFLLLRGVYLLTKVEGEWKILSARLYQFIPPIPGM